uniref:Px n=1 Tax=Cocksfoot mottle virus TaxID=40979 RepID=A0A8F8N5B8_9VIRU|nr:Px [Cocksfoot mottle virus]
MVATAVAGQSSTEVSWLRVTKNGLFCCWKLQVRDVDEQDELVKASSPHIRRNGGSHDRLPTHSDMYGDPSERGAQLDRLRSMRRSFRANSGRYVGSDSS